MRIVVQTIPAIEQRYETLGDYWFDGDGTIQVRVSDMGDRRLEFLVALHEMVEFMLCLDRGVAEADITAFDIAHPQLHEPGAHPLAPYRREHFFAECIERLVASELGVVWEEYEVIAEGTFGAPATD